MEFLNHFLLPLLLVGVVAAVLVRQETFFSVYGTNSGRRVSSDLQRWQKIMRALEMAFLLLFSLIHLLSPPWRYILNIFQSEILKIKIYHPALASPLSGKQADHPAS